MTRRRRATSLLGKLITNSELTRGNVETTAAPAHEMGGRATSAQNLKLMPRRATWAVKSTDVAMAWA